MERIIVMGRVDLVPRTFRVLGRDDPAQVLKDIADWRDANRRVWEALHPEQVSFRVRQDDPLAEYEETGWLVDATPELREAATILWSLDEVYLCAISPDSRGQAARKEESDGSQ